MWLIFWQVQLCHFYLMVITSSHKNSSLFSSLPFFPPAWLQCRFVFLAFSSCLMSFRKVQLSFCPQKQSKHCPKLITTQFSCPINSHFNSMICGSCFNIQAMEMTSLSGNSGWWKMAYIREHSEPKKSSAISHRHYNVPASICKFRPMMRLNLQGKEIHFPGDVCIIKQKHYRFLRIFAQRPTKAWRLRDFQPCKESNDPQGLWA